VGNIQNGENESDEHYITSMGKPKKFKAKKGR